MCTCEDTPGLSGSGLSRMDGASWLGCYTNLTCSPTPTVEVVVVVGGSVVVVVVVVVVVRWMDKILPT